MPSHKAVGWWFVAFTLEKLSPLASLFFCGVKTMSLSHHDSKFNVRADLEILMVNLNWKGGNEDLVIDLVSARTAAQRQEIAREYEDVKGTGIVQNLRLDPRFDFSRLMIALFMAPEEYDAQSVNNALKRQKVDTETLLEILLSRENRQIQTMKEIFNDKYHRELERDIATKTNGDFQTFLLNVARSSRQQNSELSEEKAEKDAVELSKALGTKSATGRAKVYINIFTTRSYPQLRLVFEEFKEMTGKDIIATVESAFSGQLQNALKTAATIALSPPTYFARRLYYSMKGVGTDDDTLVRVIVSRCEIDMEQIKQVFLKTYGQTLQSFVVGDTSFSYRKLLLALIS